MAPTVCIALLFIHSIMIFGDSLEYIPISSFSPAVKIHFQKGFFEGNLPLIPPNIIIKAFQKHL